MANVKLIRVDSRLIHGQVITNWIIKIGIKGILIIDDDLAIDTFMKDIYIMAAPPGIDVNVYTTQEAIDSWNDNKLGSNELLILFKDIDHVIKMHELGFPMEAVQIGGLPSGAGKRTVYKTISLGQKDFENLDKLSEAGMNIYFQMLPGDQAISYQNIKKNKKG